MSILAATPSSASIPSSERMIAAHSASQPGEALGVGADLAVLGVEGHLGAEGALGVGRRDVDADVAPQRLAQPHERVVELDSVPNASRRTASYAI